MADDVMLSIAEITRECVRLYSGGVPLSEIPESSPPINRSIPESSPPPDDRSIELLKQWLTPRQRADFEDFGCFDVIGNETGKRYRITDDSIFNILEGSLKICVVPLMDYPTPLGDRLLAQKIALETEEGHALARANIGSRSQKYPAGGAVPFETVPIPSGGGGGGASGEGGGGGEHSYHPQRQPLATRGW